MAQWAVTASRIELFEHPTSDKMLIGKVGEFQVCVAKANNYKEGDIVIFAPERAELPDSLKVNYVNSETGLSYLIGPKSNRVKAIRLRGEASEGVTIPTEWVLENFPQFTTVTDIPLDIDLSGLFGISKYEPPIPTEMAGVVTNFDGFDFDPGFIKHDVEQFRLYSKDFIPDEPVVLTEKIHGTSINILKNKSDQFAVTSKGYGARGLMIEESQSNLYWRAFDNCGLRPVLINNFPNVDVQLVGEAIPAQGGFTYGQTTPTIRVFRLIVNGDEVGLDILRSSPSMEEIFDLWVPIVYEGLFDPAVLIPYAEGKELVSGNSLHIREGVVVRPLIPRRVKRGSFDLQVKLLNTKYKPKDDDLS